MFTKSRTLITGEMVYRVGLAHMINTMSKLNLNVSNANMHSHSILFLICN